MAKQNIQKTKSGVTIKRATDQPIIVSNIVQQSADRTPKNIGHFTKALQSAESVYYPIRVALYDIYKRIIMDGALTGVWDNKRVASVSNKILKFRATTKERTEFNETINSKKFRDFVELVMHQKAWGLKGVQFKIGPVFDWYEIPNKHINAKLKIIVKHQYDQSGTSYEDRDDLMILGTNDDLGFYYKVAPLVLYKQGNWGDWANFIEKYGEPIQQFTYDIYDEKSREEAFNLASNAGGSLAICVPKQIEFNVKDGKQTNADGKLQSNFKNDLNEEIRYIVVGNNLTSTNSGGGSYSLGEVQQADQDEIIKRDMKDVLSVLNSPHFLRVLQSYGLPVEGGAFEFDTPVKPEDLKADMEVDKFLVDTVKLPLDHDYFYQKYGRPKPGNYNQLVQQQEEERQARINPPDPEDEPPPPQEQKPDNKPVKSDKNRREKLRALWSAAKAVFLQAPNH